MDVATDPARIQKAVEQAKGKAKELATQRDELLLLIKCIDLTTLSGDDQRSTVEKLTDRAVHPLNSDPSVHCGAICVYPARVSDVVHHLKKHYPNSGVNVASGRLYSLSTS
jgi:deoxyribose-phosphate aldolase